MSPELFASINMRAERRGVSFNAEAIMLMRCGLFDYEESESMDPVAEAAQ